MAKKKPGAVLIAGVITFGSSQELPPLRDPIDGAHVLEIHPRGAFTEPQVRAVTTGGVTRQIGGQTATFGSVGIATASTSFRS